jgi:hypothetical protein
VKTLKQAPRLCDRQATQPNEARTLRDRRDLYFSINSDEWVESYQVTSRSVNKAWSLAYRIWKVVCERDGIGYPSRFIGCDEPVVFSGFTYRARARQGITDATFLFYALRSEKTRRWLVDNSQASALTNINQSIADAIPIWIPPTVAEQTAIAAVLSDIDAELSSLDARRDKTYDIKLAMMQELLTGKTRLVSTAASNA